MIDNFGREIEWRVVECDEALAAKLAQEAGISPVVARVLVNRGVRTSEDVEHFLNPSMQHLHDPSLLPDLDEGVKRIASAMESGEKICVHGDYDVDGVTSTALLVRTLRALNANVEYRVPHRRRDGYDIKPAAIEECAAKGVSVVLTCDCGISALETARKARELGIDLIVTDHHEPGPVLPDAKAIIDPKRSDAGYPFLELAGVGVAFKFAQGLVRKLGHNEAAFQSRFVDLVALGTVSDVVPLLGENRALVKYGLEAIPQSKKLGFQAMLQSTNLKGKPLSTYYLAYVLGPRINAVGRMDDAAVALKLFLTQDLTEAGALAEELEHHNTQRKIEQERILAEAIEQAESKDLKDTRVLVLSNEGWSSGVVGIVAGKISEQYNRPAILISRDEASGMGHGSARSTVDFNILEGLRSCDQLLHRYGGHFLAAGLSIDLSKLDRFEEEINDFARLLIPVEEIVPQVVYDAELAPNEITRELADAIATMEPFGMANEEPIFITRNFMVVDRKRVGDGSHLRMRVQGDGSAPITVIAFGMGDYADLLELGESIDLCYSIRLNEFNGVTSVQLVGKALRPSGRIYIASPDYAGGA